MAENENQVPNELPEPVLPTNEAPNNPSTAQISGSELTKQGASKNKKNLFVVIIALIVLLTGSAGAYFGIIVPNTPENIWKKGLSNTNKSYDKLVQYAKSNKDVKGLKLKGDYKVTAGQTVVDGTIDANAYDKTSDLKLTAGTSGTRITLSALTNVAENSIYPDVYLKVDGVKSIGDLLGANSPELGAYLATLDGQWFFIDHTLFDQMQANSGQPAASPIANTLSNDDFYAIADVIGRVNKEYLLTDDPDKAVLVVKENIGKEKLDGRSVYHFKVSYEKEHLKAYATAMKDALKNTKLKELFPGQDFEQATGFENIIKGIDESKNDGTADVWVDMKTKLVSKVRFNDKDNANNYADLLMNYTGGDEYPFAAVFYSKENSGETTINLGFKLNTKTNTVTYDFTLNTTGNNPVDGKFHAVMNQSNDKVEFVKPEAVKPITDLLNGFLGGGVMGATTQIPGLTPNPLTPAPTEFQ